MTVATSKTRKPPEAAWLREVQKSLATLPILIDLRAISVGDVWGQRFHATATNELLHVLEGNAEIQFRKRSFRVGPEDTFIIPQNTPHRDIRLQGTTYRVLYVFFRWQGADGLLRKLRTHQI